MSGCRRRTSERARLVGACLATGLAAVPLVGCKQVEFREPETAAERSVARDIRQQFALWERGDPGACDYMTARRRSAFASGSRAATCADAVQDRPDATLGSIYNVSVDGSQATAHVSLEFGHAGEGWRLHLVREGGRWRQDDVEQLGRATY